MSPPSAPSPPPQAPVSLAALSAADPLVRAVADYVRAYMARYDSSHDFGHILRVLGLAHHLMASHHSSSSAVPLDARVVTLSALLHDVGDRKYLLPGEDAATMITTILTSLGAPAPLAAAVQDVCAHVSWTRESREGPAATAAALARRSELAVVQDADRLDAIGAVGVARVFAYGAARTSRALGASVAHFDEKLLLVAGRMKTAEGRRMAAARTERLALFKGWYLEEVGFAAADGEEGEVINGEGKGGEGEAGR